MKINRLNDIEKYILDVENVSLDKLCEVFNVSKNTIRRDINELEKRGSIKKVYGGIIANSKGKVEPFETREIRNQAAKKLIAQRASCLVEDGDVIFIDSGTTSMHMIPFLAQKEHLTIVTANLNVILSAMPYSNLNVISAGGVLYRETNSFTGPNVIDILKNYNVSKAFLASTGVSLTKGVTNTSPLEHEIKKHLVDKSALRVLLVDHSKFNVISLMTYCQLQDIDYLVTDQQPPQEYVDFCAANKVELLLP